jgi:hypothetical protein
MFALSIGFCILVMLGIPTERWYIAYPIYILLIAAVTCPSYYLTEEPFIRLREISSHSYLLARYNFSRQLSKIFWASPAPAPVAEKVEVRQ